VAQRVLIVGGGVIGLSTAYWAARKGLDVTVVDDSPAEGDACSFGNAGMVVPSHVVPLAAPGMVALGLRYMWNPESPFYVRPRLSGDLFDWAWRFWRSSTEGHVARAAPLLRDLSLASRAIFEEWSKAWADDFGLTQRGLLMLCRTAHGLDEEVQLARGATALGIPAQVLSAAEVAAMEPGIRLDVLGGVYFPLDCHLSPDRFMAALRHEGERAGVAFSPAEVTGWRVARGRIEAVRTTGGEQTADQYVLSAGMWSTALARELGLRLPMQAGKGLSLTLPRPRRLPVHCAILGEARVAVTPMGSALRFAGTMELAGIDRTVHPARLRGIIRSVSEYLPDFGDEDFAGIPAWSGLRPCSPDGLPYVGRVARCSNLLVGTGHAMVGISLGPITGRLLAEMLSEEPPSIDVRALSPDRHG
jgi:D-amino-acid dehydrogenase